MYDGLVNIRNIFTFKKYGESLNIEESLIILKLISKSVAKADCLCKIEKKQFNTEICKECNGRGKVYSYMPMYGFQGGAPNAVHCSACNGIGEIYK